MKKIDRNDDIHLSNFFNAMLVDARARPACLIQPVDYRELNSTDKHTKIIIDKIKEHYPNLYIINNYVSNQGTIISSEEIPINNNNILDIIDCKTMGNILGYPCSQNLANINRDKTIYSFDVSIKIKTNNNIKNIQLLANSSGISSMVIEEKFINMTNAFNVVFNEPKNKVIINNIYKYFTGLNDDVIDIIVHNECNEHIPPLQLINKLSNNCSTITANEKKEIMNALFNLSFYDDELIKIESTIQYNNQIHRGILSGLLLNYKNNICRPFYPLTKYPTKLKQVEDICKQWSNDIIELLINTKKD
jgi:hypothetical protein